jgi:hypothetical protein
MDGSPKGASRVGHDGKTTDSMIDGRVSMLGEKMD